MAKSGEGNVLNPGEASYPTEESTRAEDKNESSLQQPNPTWLGHMSTIAPGFDIQGSQAFFDRDESSTAFNSFSLPVSWHHLKYSAGEKKILRGLTGTALPFRCLAIMGSSGAGKTTFLNAISDRLATSRTLKLSGRRQLGDVPYEHRYRKVMGFVHQDDIISSLGTPSDALRFSLRCRRGTTALETKTRVAETLEVLRLSHCRDTMVGIPGLVAGLSGGERKRCNIGVELICDPMVMLLDEPTSGLDSVTSAKIINLLGELSRTGRTIIYTIHQPTAEVLSYFDDLMLMAQGKCVYHGTMADSVQYFTSIGFPCPENYTPTDYYMTLLQDSPTAKVLIKRWRRFLKYGKRTPHTAAVRLAPVPSESKIAKHMNGYMEKFGSTPWVQFLELVKRETIELSRNRLYIFAHANQALFFSIVVGLIFLKLTNDVDGIQDRQGLLFMTVMDRSMGPAFIMINSFHRVKAVYLREQQVGAYSPLLYFLARSLAEFPMQIFFILIQVIIVYFLTGLHLSAGAFFYFFAAIALVAQVATGLGFAVSASFDNLVVASAVTPLVLLPMVVSGGLLASTTRLRPYWYWLEKISHPRYGYILTTRNEFDRLHNITCDYAKKGDAFCVNQPKDGKQVLEIMGFEDEQSQTWILWLSLAILFFLYRVIVVLALNRAARTKA